MNEGEIKVIMGLEGKIGSETVDRLATAAQNAAYVLYAGVLDTRAVYTLGWTVFNNYHGQVNVWHDRDAEAMKLMRAMDGPMRERVVIRESLGDGDQCDMVVINCPQGYEETRNCFKEVYRALGYGRPMVFLGTEENPGAARVVDEVVRQAEHFFGEYHESDGFVSAQKFKNRRPVNHPGGPPQRRAARPERPLVEGLALETADLGMSADEMTRRVTEMERRMAEWAAISYVPYTPQALRTTTYTSDSTR